MIRILVLLLALTGLAASAHASEGGPGRTLVEFEIEDQFKTVRSHTDFEGQVVILIGSDRHSADFTEAWGESLGVGLGDEADSGWVAFLPVANLKSVPFFLKGTVRGKFPKDPEAWAVADWKGQIAEAYGFIDRRCNILVFDREHRLVFQTHVGEYDPDLRDLILGRIRRLKGSKSL